MLWAGLAALSLVLSISEAVAQTTNVTKCIAGYEWAINSRGQNPCLVGAYLETSCSSLPISINSLTPGDHYLGPTFSAANPCLCSSVVYSLVSACGGCQFREYTTWTNWTINCRSLSQVTTFPRDIPPAVEVPTWAYLDIRQTNNNFDPIAAQNENARASPTTSAQPSESSRISTSSPPNKSHAGAIAGGVVGGLVFLLVVGMCILRVRRRRRQQGQERMNLDDSPLAPVSPPTMQERSLKTTPSSGVSRITPFPYTPPQDALLPKTVTSSHTAFSDFGTTRGEYTSGAVI